MRWSVFFCCVLFRVFASVRKHLLYFSLAAPLTSLLTYVSFSYYNRVAGASGSLSANTPDGQALLGLCLLFSAGTFLFTIAVHILPEIQPAANTVGGGGGGQGAAKQPPQQQAPKSMLLALIFGILAPLLFSSHNHGH
jgi:zinc transporter 9